MWNNRRLWSCFSLHYYDSELCYWADLNFFIWASIWKLVGWFSSSAKLLFRFASTLDNYLKILQLHYVLVVRSCKCKEIKKSLVITSITNWNWIKFRVGFCWFFQLVLPKVFWVLPWCQSPDCWLFVFQLKSVTVPPMNGSHADGECGVKEQHISVIYADKRVNVTDMNVTFIFTMNNNSMYQMSSVLLNATANNVPLNGWLRSFLYFLPARRYASAGLCDSDVSVCLSVRPSVCHTPVLCLAERKQDCEICTIW